MPKQAKQPEKAHEIRLKEILGFKLDGITVFVEIDYNTRQVSLIERDGKGKQWVFTKRTPDYFKGWHRILNAMKFAIDQANARLEEQPSDLQKYFEHLALKGDE